MNRKTRVQSKLKPKVRQFGFTNKVFKSIAAHIADNLDLADGATEEEVDAAIDTAIEAALPTFAFIQSQAGALRDEWVNNHKKDVDEEDDDPDDDNPDDDVSVDEGATSRKRNRPAKSAKNKDKDADKEPAWFKTYREQQEARFKALENEKTAESRRSKLDGILKDTGTFGKRILKSYSKMSFKDDEDFDEFLADVEEDLKALNQERADEGLSAMGTPPGGKGNKREKQTEAFSDEEIDALAD